MWFHRVKKVFHEPAGFVRQPSRPRKAVGAAFSSVSVLNASFRRSGKGIPLGSSAESSGVDLLKVTLRPEDGENMGLTVVQNVHEMSMILCWNTPNLDDILWWFLPTSAFFWFLTRWEKLTTPWSLSWTTQSWWTPWVAPRSPFAMNSWTQDSNRWSGNFVRLPGGFWDAQMDRTSEKSRFTMSGG